MSELLKINVNDHTERKNGLTYLSWAWAWAEVLKIDPAATWEPMSFGAANDGFQLLCNMPDGTAFVGVTATVNKIARSCMLPVMDHRNKAIQKPNAFDVNKAVMRCLAKAIAMHGLGLYIYAGEDLPEGEEDDGNAASKKREDTVTPMKRTGGTISGPKEAWRSLPPDWQAWLHDVAPQLENVFEQQGAEAARDMVVKLVNENQLEAEHIAGLWSLVKSNVRSAIDRLNKAA